MARITVEDCLNVVKNRFNLVLVAAARARQIAMGGQTQVARRNEKDTVIALREISLNLINENTMHAAAPVTSPIADKPADKAEVNANVIAENLAEIEAETQTVIEDTAGTDTTIASIIEEDGHDA